MRRFYGAKGSDWEQCIPECVNVTAADVRQPSGSAAVCMAGIGFLIQWKGWHHVVEAIALLPETTRGRLKFRHIGAVGATPTSAHYARKLLTRTKGLHLTESVEWLGEQPSSTPLLQRSDCLVVASLNEPFSLAMLEALYAGVPVIAADSGGAVDLIEPGRNGWLFRSGDSVDLARVLRSLVETDALAKIQIDREGLRRFSAPVVAQQWAAVYARVLEHSK